MAERRTLIAANWKMNLLRDEAKSYCATLGAALTAEDPEVVLFPPFVLLPLVSEGLAETAVAWGAQDLHNEDGGAHTGCVSGAQLAEWGTRWALCGHSERRRDHHETDPLVRLKVEAALRNHLKPMLCVGETLEERQRGETFTVLKRQLLGALPSPSPQAAVAYEPVWAIGTGHNATPEVAQEAHEFLRRALREQAGDSVAGGMRILYGGSVKPSNAEALLAQPDVDGFLVGGASLDPKTFLDIIRSARRGPGRHDDVAVS